MKHIHYLDEKPEQLTQNGAHGAVIRHLITEKDGASNFNLRHVSIETNGQTPDHSHPWEHEMFVVRGTGIAEVGENKEPLKPGDAVYVPPDTRHTIRASEPMEIV